MNETPLEVALGYAARGWAVFPCHEPLHSGCSCRRRDCPSPAKHPRTRNGLRDATTDREVIERCWRRWPTANIAVRTGSESGLVVLDVDPAHGGHSGLAEVQRTYGPLPRTASVRTGSGGRHFWFVHPGRTVPNSAGRVGPGLDIRGDGGYVISPPSRHSAGLDYVWASKVVLQPVPDWLLALSWEQAEGPRPRSAVNLDSASGSWARAAIRGEIQRVEQSVEGTRNDTLNRAAFALGQIIGAGLAQEDKVRDALLAAGLRAGLRPSEARATVASGLRAGTQRPRGPTDVRCPQPSMHGESR